MIDIFYFEHSKVLINVLALTCMHSFVYIYIHVLGKFCDNQKYLKQERKCNYTFIITFRHDM